MTDLGFGRRPALDERDRAYPLRAAMYGLSLDSYYHHRTGPILDQGQTGTCVGHAWRQWLSSALIMTKSGPDALALYLNACRRDPWTENDTGDLFVGTTVRAGAQALQALGHIAEYRWSWSAAELATWLLLRNGVVVIGSNWYAGMMRPPASGVIQPTGSLAGGHAYVLSGVNQTRGVFRIVNSWGPWGDAGRAWITGEHLQRLLDEDGEACCGTETVVA